ncbi:sugar-transfer associated ATP-grasp domain-containing protein [Flavivirga sp. 57AJ16]|uniref:sugar-transfer associated ATP-grasp domain-containing protein n=1 Tax=Flavivirga sp. 57AJ16 TaxID=3025307 RepID=UPI0023665463|nr:sugar-transfer associated ATP-grasp domain-containing protein [Flavivirga sp. 57AJ16]MDD7885836.1 sugar-transfer associated ATP-grasp domain-containing protein [Flavivirga sp. 57AJ16]
MKLLYLLYVLKNTDYKKLNTYIKHVSNLKKTSSLRVILNMFTDFLRYNMTFLDYFYLEFFNRSKQEKKTYASTIFMYKFQKKLNGKLFIKYFYDKKLFYDKFEKFVCHGHFLPHKNTPEAFKEWLKIKSPKSIIVKNSKGQVGSGIEKFEVTIKEKSFLLNKMSVSEFLDYISLINLDLIEVCIEQHDVLNDIYPESLNTLRVITIIDKENNVHIIGAILRMGAGKYIDNFDAGGVSAKVNIETGVIEGPVIYKTPLDTTFYKNHPVNNNKIVGIQLPYWEEATTLVKKASLHIPEVRTVGWDVVLTNQGAFLLEGNHNWDKTHWQMCLGTGLKYELNKYMDNILS